MNKTRPFNTSKAQASRLRDEIDRGNTNDKVEGSDPAAAPLGTDAEAGGIATSTAAMKTAIAYETRPLVKPPTAAIDQTTAHNPFAFVFLGMIFLTIGAFIVALWLVP